MSKHYFTFGFGQKHQNGYAVIEAPDWRTARLEMLRRWGREWAFQYSEKDWVLEDGRTQAETFGLHEVK